MQRKYLILLSVSIAAALLMTVSVVINMKYDAVEVIPEMKPYDDGSGVPKAYVYPAYEPKEKIAKVVSELLCTFAIALFIYFVIEHTIHKNEKKQEQKHQQEFLSQAGNVVLLEILGKLMPDVLFETVKHDVISHSFITEKVEWEYDIVEIGDHYRVIQHISSNFKNITNSKKTLPLEISLYQNANNKSWFESFEIKQGTKSIVSENKEKMEQNAKIVGNRKMRDYSQSIEPNETLTVSYVIYNDYASKYVQDIHFSKYSITDLTIRINKFTKCKFTGIGTFTQKLEIDKNEDIRLRYKPVNGILKGQSFVFLIEPSDTKEVVPENGPGNTATA